MPELPEVETIRRAIEPAIVGTRVTDITLLDTSIAGPEGPASLQSAIGSPVRAVLRRGKHLILLLERNRGVVLHLRMTGAILLAEPAAQARVRAILSFSNGVRLFFNDMRRLGTIRMYEDLKPLLVRLGPEPFDPDFTADMLAQSLSRHSIPIKAALLDQHIAAGIGNMYADEALHRAGIHPLKPAAELSEEEVTRLFQSIREVLTHAIECQGASIDTYWQPSGERGTAHDVFAVAHKKGDACPTCGTSINRIMVRKRGAYFCPLCQPAVQGDLSKN